MGSPYWNLPAPSQTHGLPPQSPEQFDLLALNHYSQAFQEVKQDSTNARIRCSAQEKEEI